MSSPSTGIGWGVSWSQVVVGFCRTPSLQCGIFPTLGDIIGGQNVAQRVMGNILQCWNWSTMFGILPDQLFNIVHIVRWQCETIWCQTFATSKSNTWQFAIVSCDGRCDVWNSFLQTSHWQEYLVCGESKCPIDQVFSWHGLFINITASYRYNNGKGGFFVLFWSFCKRITPKSLVYSQNWVSQGPEMHWKNTLRMVKAVSEKM